MDDDFTSLEEIDRAITKARKDEDRAIMLANVAHKLVIALEALRALWISDHGEDSEY